MANKPLWKGRGRERDHRLSLLLTKTVLLIVGAILGLAGLQYWNLKTSVLATKEKVKEIAEELQPRIESYEKEAILPINPNPTTRSFNPPIVVSMEIGFKGCHESLGCRFTRGPISASIPGALDASPSLKDCAIIVDEMALIVAEGVFKGTRVWSGDLRHLGKTFYVPPELKEGKYRFQWNVHSNCPSISTVVTLKDMDRVFELEYAPGSSEPR